MGLGPIDLTGSIIGGITQIQTINLALIVGLIMIMSNLMEKSGHMTRLVNSFSHLAKDGRTVGSVMAALIGILPMPGGALFSAPIVQAAIPAESITGEKKTALNYWFRHIWEYWWPLYPGVILAVTLLEVDAWRYMLIMIPMTLASVIAGIIFILRPIGKIESHQKKTFESAGICAFIHEMIPILIVIFFIICLTLLTTILEIKGIGLKINSSLSVLLGLVVSIAWIARTNKVSGDRLLLAVTSKNVWTMIFLVLSIIVFKEIMVESQAVVQIRNELVAYGIPILLIIIMMPFLSGIITGIALGFVGASFPLIIPMFQTPDLFEYLSSAMLAYTFGYMGMILSPVHLCLLVTKDYFKANLLKSYLVIIKPALTVMLTAVVLFILIRILF